MREVEEYDLSDLDNEDGVPEWQKHEWTTQEVKFVSEFLRTGKRRAAYVLAYVDDPEEAAGKEHHQKHYNAALHILKKPHIREYIEYVRGKVIKSMAVTKDNVLGELAKLGYSNMSDFVVLQADGTPQFDMNDLSRDQAAAIQEMTIDTYMEGRGEGAREVKSVKVKLAPKLGALEALGKHLKLFTDVIQTDTASIADIMRQRRQEARKRKKKEAEDDDGEDKL